MITVICGLIGAGKTTYARDNFEHYTDWDELKSKTVQIEKTRELHCQGQDVAHITCFPAPKEIEFFNTIPEAEIRYVWINTTEKQSEKNIRARRRECDLQYLNDVLLKNSNLVKMVRNSEIPFEFVDVFPTDERW